MTQEHPVTPPPELVQQWDREWREQQNAPVIGWSANLLAYITIRAAQWGADQELEACCEWLDREGWSGESRQLCAARRPKPSSLKEQALEAVKQIPVEPDGGPWRTAMETIIFALHQLPDND
jgi:hypothetical protein